MDHFVGDSLEWKNYALCKDRGDLFFPEYEDPKLEDKIKEARSICNKCPVKDICKDYGSLEEFGIWGGEVREIWYND